MNTRRRRLQLIALLLGLSTISAGGSIVETRAANASPKSEAVLVLPRGCAGCGHHSGMFGIATLQVARINVVSLRETTEPPADLELRFYDSVGTVLAQSRVSLVAGHAAFLDLPHRDLRRAGRTMVRAEVVGVDPREEAPGWAVTLEVYDALTGRTGLFVADSAFLARDVRTNQ